MRKEEEMEEEKRERKKAEMKARDKEVSYQVGFCQIKNQISK